MCLIAMLLTSAATMYPQAATSVTLGYPGHWGHLSYTVSGAQLEPPSGSDAGFIGGRQYKGTLSGRMLTVSGNAASDNESSGPGSGDYYELVVSVTVGKEHKEYSYIAPRGERLNRPFSLAVPIDPGASSGSFSIRLIEQNANYGARGWAVSGSLRVVAPQVANVEPSRTKSAARFSGMQGQVEVLRASDPTHWVIAKLDMILNLEDRVKTTEGASCILSFADMSTFVLKEESEVVIVDPSGKDSKWKLVAGNIWTNVKKLMKDGTMEIDINQAVAGIKGTTLTLSTNRSISTINVIEGAVEFRSKATGETVTLYSGESVSATSNGLTVKRPIDVSALEREWDAVRMKALNRSPLDNTAIGKPTAVEKEIFSNSNIYGVDNGGRSPLLKFIETVTITYIMTYHWNFGRGSPTGTIALVRDDGTIFGPWKAVGTAGQGGVPNANWEVRPNIVIPAGRYQVIDSDPSTWAQNSASGGKGMVVIKGIN